MKKSLAIAYAVKRKNKTKSSNENMIEEDDSFLSADMESPFESQPYENESGEGDYELDNTSGNSQQEEDRVSLKSIMEKLRRKNMGR